MEKRHFKITFEPSGLVVERPEGSLLSQAAHEAGIPIDSSCGGRGKCGKCRGRIKAGEVSEPTLSEKNLIAPQDLELGYLLLCQRTVLSDCIVESIWSETADGSPLEKGILMDLPAGADSPLSKVFVELSPPTVEDAGRGSRAYFPEASAKVEDRTGSPPPDSCNREAVRLPRRPSSSWMMN